MVTLKGLTPSGKLPLNMLQGGGQGLKEGQYLQSNEL